MAKSTKTTKRPATAASSSGTRRSKISSTIREALPETCTKADLSIILDVSIRALSDLDQRGLLVHGPVRGTYLLLPTLHAYAQRLRNAAAGRGRVRKPRSTPSAWPARRSGAGARRSSSLRSRAKS